MEPFWFLTAVVVAIPSVFKPAAAEREPAPGKPDFPVLQPWRFG